MLHVLIVASALQYAGHPEVEGTLGQIPGPIHLVATVDDVAMLDIPDTTPVAYVTQTTLSLDETRGVIEALQARFADVVGPGTADICYATQNRQNAVRALCEQAELLLVVGSPKSSNSNRLREIGLEMGRTAYLVEDGSAIDPAWLRDVETVGLTAGASAPEELVQSVVAAIAALRPVEITMLDGIEEKLQFRLPPALNRLAPAEQAA